MSDENDRDRPEPQPPHELPLHLQQTQAGGSLSDSRSSSDADSSARLDLEIPGYSDLVELHRGGQGIVYRALQMSTRRTVAIKVLREGPQADASARKRFQREAHVVAQLEHPNIVSVFDSGTTSRGELYFVMEFVRGMELDRSVQTRKLTVEDIVQLYRTVLDAVQHAHERGIVHRDLKPSNVLIDESGQPRLVDFGLARALRTNDSFASLTGQVLGTMAYMSPEQVRAAPDIDARTDVYSLGVILYELLTGTSPYPASSQVLDALRHITETPPRPLSRSWSVSGGVQRRSGTGRRGSGRCPIDADLETIVLKAIAKEPLRRYASAREFADDLARHAAGLPVNARRESGVYVFKKAVSRHRRGILWAVVAILVSTLVWFFVPRPQRAATPQLDPATVAEYAAAEARYAETRVELQSALDARVASGELKLDPTMQESLRIVADAIAQLRAALAKDPGNRKLRQLLLDTYDQETSLLRRIATLPASSAPAP